MTILIATETNCETGETINRPLTAEEVQAIKSTNDAWNSQEAARIKTTEANATAKAALLARLGITADEAKLLLG
jgi:hypothetical protein